MYDNLHNLELLEFLRYIIGCKNISDLRIEFYNERAKALFDKLNLANYSLTQIEDAIRYLDIE
jgi:hypothetical protein